MSPTKTALNCNTHRLNKNHILFRRTKEINYTFNAAIKYTELARFQLVASGKQTHLLIMYAIHNNISPRTEHKLEEILQNQRSDANYRDINNWRHHIDSSSH